MKRANKNNLWAYITILIVAIIMCVPLMQKGIQASHDGDFHISRAIGTIEQLEKGESPFVVARFSNELGFGWNLFYPPINTAINVIFAVLTGNAIFAMKLFIFFTFFLSGITMYQFVLETSKNKVAAIFSSLLYMIAPYRLLNVYTRLAVGEMVSFIFIPMIFRGVYLIFKEKTEKSYLFILGAIGLILSHNISTMLVCIIGVVYIVMNIKKLKNPKIIKTFCASAVIIILSVIFFEIPLLEQKFSAEYEVFRYGKMYSRELVRDRGINPLQLLMKNVPFLDGTMYFCIGLPLLIGAFLTPIAIKRLDKEKKKDYKFFLVVGIVSCFMATFIFPWYYMPEIFLMIQFPWRMLEIVVFCFSIISGINFAIMIPVWLEKRKKANLKLVETVVLILFCLYSISFFKTIEWKNIDDNHYQEKEIIDTTNYVSRYSSFLEYWPQKAIDSINYITNRDNKILVLNGEALIESEEKDGGILTFYIKAENANLELPYLFYKGYQAQYKDENGNIKKLELIESDKGLVQLVVTEPIEGEVTVEYHATTLHKICIWISGITIVGYSTYLIILWIKKKNNKKQEIKFLP